MTASDRGFLADVHVAMLTLWEIKRYLSDSKEDCAFAFTLTEDQEETCSTVKYSTLAVP